MLLAFKERKFREGIACVKHQNMSGSDMGDDHKEYFAGEAALKAAGKDNTMNQFLDHRPLYQFFHIFGMAHHLQD